MPKKIKILDLTTKEPLIERQRKLWNASDAIDLANYRKEPLPEDLAKWLFSALRNVAFGENANAVLDVITEKRGVRKGGLKQEINKKIVLGAIATATQSESPKKTKTAIEEVTQALPVIKKSTARKSWNKASTDRKPHFSFGKK